MIEINKDLETLREEINSIDNTILSLLEARARAVHEVGELKKGSPVPIYVPARERAIFDRLSSMSSLPKDMIISVFREIISACRSLEGILSVGILEDLYSEAALREILGTHVKSVAFKDLQQLLKAVPDLSYLLLPKDPKTLNYVEKNSWLPVNEIIFKDHPYLLIKV